jgi:hypothetical protein
MANSRFSGAWLRSERPVRRSPSGNHKNKIMKHGDKPIEVQSLLLGHACGRVFWDRGILRLSSGMEPDSTKLSAGKHWHYLRRCRALSNVAKVVSVNSERSNRPKLACLVKGRFCNIALPTSSSKPSAFRDVPKMLRAIAAFPGNPCNHLGYNVSSGTCCFTRLPSPGPHFCSSKCSPSSPR